MLKKDQINFSALAILVLVSRVFFLNQGYGVEEDSWGLVLNALQISGSKEYVMSRMPGHPFQEIVLAALWKFNHSPLIFNGISALFSLIAIVYFYMILKEFKFRYSFLASAALAYTPAVYITSTYTIDYIWALAFLLMSYYYILKSKYITAGVLIGLAIACRITSGAMLIPFVLTILVYGKRNNFRNSVVFILFCVFITVLLFFPVFHVYGIDFLSYYQLPYPPLTKALYKGTIGVAGLTGSIAFIILTVLLIFKQKLRSYKKSFSKNIDYLLLPWAIAVILFTIAYFKYPQKAAFLIPALPFLILLSGYILRQAYFKALCISLIISPFFISIDITDKYRGSSYSDYSVIYELSGQEIYIDPLNGPIFADRSKRINKQNFTTDFIKEYNQINPKTVIICGWWYNQIEVNLLEKQKNTQVKLVSFADEEKLRTFIREGYTIRYLPEQDEANDSKYFGNFTRKYGLLIQL